MVQIREIVRTDKFDRDLRRIRDNLVRERVVKLVEEVAEDPSVGKPLRHGLKGEWSARLSPFRMIYVIQDDQLILLRFVHRKNVYD